MEGRYYQREGFRTNMQGVTKASMERHLDDLEVKTDIIDDALHFGIKSKFYKYLEAMSEFKNVESSVVKQIESIQQIK